MSTTDEKELRVLQTRPHHLYTMPPTSARRKEFEQLKTHAQEVIDRCARRHALLDLWERKAQFPYIDIFTFVTPYHLHGLVAKFLDFALNVSAFWLRVVFFATLVEIRITSFPPKIVPKLKGFLERIKWDKSEMSLTHLPNLKIKHRSKILIQRYNIKNAVEAAVVLSCLEKNALNSLHVQDETNKFSSQEFQFSSVAALVPEKEDTLFHEDNLALLQCYLSAELNLWIPTTVFQTHPGAKEIVTLPSSDLSRIPSPESVPFFFAASIPQLRRLETRLKEIVIVQQQSSQQEEKQINLRSNYNPKTFRAEIRDELNSKMERALMRYENASQNLKPMSPEEEMDKYSGQNSAQVQPTYYFFVRKLKAEPTVALALSLDMQGEVRRFISDAAREMYLERLYYFDDHLRYIHNQQSKLALSFLDSAVERLLAEKEEIFGSSQSLGLEAIYTSETHIPLADRRFDEYGGPSQLSKENYERRYIDPLTTSNARETSPPTALNERTV